MEIACARPVGQQRPHVVALAAAVAVAVAVAVAGCNFFGGEERVFACEGDL